MAITAGKQHKDDVYPSYRWVPPHGFAEYSVASLPPWGVFESPAPAYQSPPQKNCTYCMSGLGLTCDSTAELYANQAKWMFWGGVLGFVIGVAAVPMLREYAR